MEEGEKGALQHFDTLLETAFPPTSSLLGHYLKGYLKMESSWFKKAFLWEKIQLFRELRFYYGALKEREKEREFESLISKTFKEHELLLSFI